LPLEPESEYFSIMFTTLACLAAVAGHIISRILVLGLAITVANHLDEIHIHIHNDDNNHSTDNHTGHHNEENHDKQAHKALPAAHHGDLLLEFDHQYHHFEQDTHHDQAD